MYKYTGCEYTGSMGIHGAIVAPRKHCGNKIWRQRDTATVSHIQHSNNQTCSHSAFYLFKKRIPCESREGPKFQDECSNSSCTRDACFTNWNTIPKVYSAIWHSCWCIKCCNQTACNIFSQPQQRPIARPSWLNSHTCSVQTSTVSLKTSADMKL